MALIFNKWGLSGPLTTFPVWIGNGVQGDWGTIDPAIIGDRADVVTLAGAPTYRIICHALDPVTVSGYRTELHSDMYSHIADWVGEGVGGATIANAIRQYRFQFMIPSGVNLNWVGNTPSPHFTICQLHQVHDDNPGVEDTAGLNPALSIRVRLDAGVYRCALLRNTDTTPTITVANTAIQQQEWASWPFEFDVEYSVHVAVKWSYSNQGYMHVYVNRHLIFSEVALPNCPNNSPARGGGGMYAKIGPYMTFNEETVIYHRGLLMSDNADFAEMYPELSAAQAVPLERISRYSSTLGGFGSIGI